MFVLLAEPLPIAETCRAVTLLQIHGVPIGGLVENRILPSPTAEHPCSAARQEQQFHYLEEIHLPLLRRDVVGKDALAESASVLEEAMM